MFFSCQKETSFELGQAASGSLQTQLGACLPKVVAGNFIAGTAFSGSSYVDVTVSVTQKGFYTITTDTVNGYFFKGTGSFDSVGENVARLVAIGQPVVEGTDQFTVSFDSSTCVFQVTVDPAGTVPPSPAAGVYLPLTDGSWWTYDGNPGTDTVKLVNTGMVSIQGRQYQRRIAYDTINHSNDTSYVRKENGIYFQYLSPADLEQIGFPEGATSGVEYVILKDQLSTGDVYFTDIEYTVAGNKVTMRLKNTVLNANATVTRGSNTFNNVYKISMVLQAGAGNVFTNVGSTVEFYYAPEIGLIKQVDNNNNQRLEIRYWNLN